MKAQEYLQLVLDNQSLAGDSKELEELRLSREKVEKLLKDKFPHLKT